MKRKPKLGRPPMPKAERRMAVRLRLPPDLVLALDAAAHGLGLTRTAMLERLIRRCIRLKKEGERMYDDMVGSMVRLNAADIEAKKRAR